MQSSETGIFDKLAGVIRALGLAAGIVISIGPAEASVLYNFVPSSMSTPPGAPYTTFSVVGSLELTDAAVASGSFGLADITDFSFRVNNGFDFSFTANPGDPVPPFANGLVSPAGLLTSGSMGQLTQNDSLFLTGDAAGVWSGQFITDGSAQGCNLTAFPCQFTGTWEAVAIPEPASLALLGVGCFAALALGRGRRRAMR
jgi:hypothetical protein